MFSDLLYRLRALFRRDSMEAELDEELRGHINHQAEKYVQLGISREAAQLRAKIELGGVDQVKEECRDAWGVWFIEALLQDLRFCLRTLVKNRVFTAVMVLTLALGIGANTAIFTVIDSILLRPLAYPHAERIIKVGSIYEGSPYSGTVIAGPHYRFLEQYSRSFE